MPRVADTMAKLDKTREHEEHSLETGAKGGQFYTTATGAKVYVNK